MSTWKKKKKAFTWETVVCIKVLIQIIDLLKSSKAIKLHKLIV